jgi:hypothetical protein
MCAEGRPSSNEDARYLKQQEHQGIQSYEREYCAAFVSFAMDGCYPLSYKQCQVLYHNKLY